MRHLIMITLLFLAYSKSYSEECVFTGTVDPVGKTETVKEIYNITCRFFTGTFNAKLDPNMKLDSVRYVDSWEGVEIVSDDDNCAVFHNGTDPSVNEIYVNTNGCKDTFPSGDQVFEDSLVSHEMIHFFFKSANLKYLTENGIERNTVMEESLAYWCQNEYIKEVSGGKKGIMDYTQSGGQNFKSLDPDTFIRESQVLFVMSDETFIYHSIDFLNGSTKERYAGIVNNNYASKPDQFLYN